MLDAKYFENVCWQQEQKHKKKSKNLAHFLFFFAADITFQNILHRA